MKNVKAHIAAESEICKINLNQKLESYKYKRENAKYYQKADGKCYEEKFRCITFPQSTRFSYAPNMNVQRNI